MIYVFYIIGVMIITVYVFHKFSNLIIKQLNKNKYNNYKYYIPKKFMTNYEKYFFNILVELENEYFIRIQPQVNLATIVDINTSGYKNINELFKNIDFAIFTKDYDNLLLLIEINDKTHNLPKRRKRDKKIKDIASEAGIKLITFYSNYPNNKEYVKNRIIKELNINR